MDNAIQVLFILIAFILLVYLVWNIIYFRGKKIVKDTSTQLKNLLELNSKYTFDYDIKKQYKFYETFQSKPKFDKYELETLFDKSILYNYGLVIVAEKVLKNRKLYEEYQKKVSNLKSEILKEETKNLHISYKGYIKIEKNLFLKYKLSQPILNSDIICTATYTSPKGRNHYSKKAAYSIVEAPKRYELLQKRIEQQNSEEMRRKHARSQMTDKLRYTILKRDKFKCQICGRTVDDGIKLHVDHIIPVSKGGETVPSNLRTLCQACNLGKSDEIE